MQFQITTLSQIVHLFRVLFLCGPHEKLDNVTENSKLPSKNIKLVKQRLICLVFCEIQPNRYPSEKLLGSISKWQTNQRRTIISKSESVIFIFLQRLNMIIFKQTWCHHIGMWNRAQWECLIICGVCVRVCNDFVPPQVCYDTGVLSWERTISIIAQKAFYCHTVCSRSHAKHRWTGRRKQPSITLYTEAKLLLLTCTNAEPQKRIKTTKKRTWNTKTRVYFWSSVWIFPGMFLSLSFLKWLMFEVSGPYNSTSCTVYRAGWMHRDDG